MLKRGNITWQKHPEDIWKTVWENVLLLSSEHLPLKSKHDIEHLQTAGDLLKDAVLLPQLVQLPVALRTQMQRIPTAGMTDKQITSAL